MSLRGLSKDEVIGEDVREHRRTMRVAWSVGIALFALAVSLAFAFSQAKIARDEERVQRSLAEQRLRVATARELASLARDQFVDAQLSLLVALHAAYETYARDGTVTPEAQEALQWALQWPPLPGTHVLETNRSMFHCCHNRPHRPMFCDTRRHRCHIPAWSPVFRSAASHALH